MDYAKDLDSGKIVAAEDASPTRSYACPRPGCGGRVYLPGVVIQRPHFRHYPGEGTIACDEYFPGVGSGSESGRRAVGGGEEDPSELDLVLTQVDGCWGLGLRLPEIRSDELGETSLETLRSAHVNVYTGRDRLLRVSALELRPGVGAVRVDVVPALETFRTEPAGSWPDTVDKNRWLLDARGLDAKGALFRLRHGEWTRLLPGSGVHHGETLLVLADVRCAPPDPIVSEPHARIISSGGLQWGVWEVRLPSALTKNVLSWLGRLGHEVLPRPWSVALATPPRVYGAQGEPVFWSGDSPIIVLQAPESAAAAMIGFQSGTNSHSVAVRVDQARFAHVSVTARDAGLTQLVVAGERSASLDLTFIRRPQDTTLAELLLRPARLRIQIGQHQLEAWQEPVHKVRIHAREQPQVRVDLGDETARARVTMWERHKLRSKRGLDARGVARELEDALVDAERIEVDAGNLGRVTLLPQRARVDAPHAKKLSNRLVWREHLLSMCSQADECSTSVLLEQPRTVGALTVRQVAPACLASSRMALRRRLEPGGPPR